MTMPEITADFVVREAHSHGFALAGVTDTLTPRRYQAYLDWIQRRHHGTMAYMASRERRDARADVREVMASTKSAIVVAMAYEKPTPHTHPLHGVVASYAVGDDYHHVMKTRLAKLARSIEQGTQATLEWRACVDSAPVLEREFAVLAGLGFVGKNTMLIAPGIGSYVLLGLLLVNIEILNSHSETNNTPHCGTCTACLDACPTGAFAAPYQLDARRCIAYLTIEHKGEIAEELRNAIGNRVFGCDVCQSVCPFNASPIQRATVAPELASREPSRRHPSLLQLEELGSSQHKKFVRRSAMRRASRRQWRRNIAVALGNSASNDAIEALDRLAAEDSVVADHAEWALRKLRPKRTDVSSG